MVLCNEIQYVLDSHIICSQNKQTIYIIDRMWLSDKKNKCAI